MKTILGTVVILAMNAGVVAAQETDDAQMLALTQSVLQGINGEDEPAPQNDERPDLSSLVSQAMEQGKSDEYLEALLGEAIESGAVEVSEAMVSTEGEVDTKTLLASLVNQSLANSGTDDVLASEATGNSEETEPRSHTVASGESLAGIALQYYGDATKFDAIFAANRDTIARPNLIRVGQVILIP